MRTPTFIRGLVLAIGLTVGLIGQDKAATPLKYDELVLTDGRKLTKVVIKSFDAKSGKLLLVAAGKAMVLSADLVPATLAAEIKQNAPQAGGTTSSTGERKVTPMPVAPQAPAPVVAAPPAISTEELNQRQKDAALTRARNYYRYEFPVGSDAARVTALNIELQDPEPVAGWTGRYRMQGSALLEWFDSRGWSFKRGTSRFEVTTEMTTGTPKVVDFSIK